MANTRGAFDLKVLHFARLAKAKDCSPEQRALASTTLNKLDALAKEEKDVGKLMAAAQFLHDEYQQAIKELENKQPQVEPAVETPIPAAVALVVEDHEAPINEYWQAANEILKTEPTSPFYNAYCMRHLNKINEMRAVKRTALENKSICEVLANEIADAPLIASTGLYLERTIQSFNANIDQADQDRSLLIFSQDAVLTLSELREAEDDDYVFQVCDYLIDEEKKMVENIEKAKTKKEEERKAKDQAINVQREVLPKVLDVEPATLIPIPPKSPIPKKVQATKPIVTKVQTPVPLPKPTPTPTPTPISTPAPAMKKIPAVAIQIPKDKKIYKPLIIAGSILIGGGIGVIAGALAAVAVGVELSALAIGIMSVLLLTIGSVLLGRGLQQRSLMRNMHAAENQQTHQKVTDFMQKHPGKDEKFELTPPVELAEIPSVMHEVKRLDALAKVNTGIAEERRVTMSA